MTIIKKYSNPNQDFSFVKPVYTLLWLVVVPNNFNQLDLKWDIMSIQTSSIGITSTNNASIKYYLI